MAGRSQGIVVASRTHLAEARESYWTHFRFAAAVGSMMAAAGIACLIHALVPGLCRNTASRTIRLLHRVVEDRSVVDRAVVQSAEAIAFAFLVATALAIGAGLWLAGAEMVLCLSLMLLALGLPMALLAVDPDLEGEAGDASPSAV